MTNMKPTVIAKILSNQPNFTLSENEIANFVLDNPDFVIGSTITSLAREVGVSEASINRFCKKIGNKGFNDFKIALVQETYYQSMKLNKDTRGRNGIIESMMHDYNDLILNVSALISEEELFKSSSLVKRANTVHIFCLMNTQSVALDFKLKLNMIGLRADVHPSSLSIKLCTSNIEKEDLVFIISPSIDIHDLSACMRICSDKGVHVITITAYDSPKLNDYATVKFVTSDKIIVENALTISNNIMFMFIIDLIFTAVVKGDKRFQQRKLNSDALFQNQQIVDNFHEY